MPQELRKSTEEKSVSVLYTMNLGGVDTANLRDLTARPTQSESDESGRPNGVVSTTQLQTGKVDVYTPHTRSHTHMWTLLRHLPVHISRIAIMQHFHLLPFLLAGWVRWDAQETAPISTIKFASKIKLRSDRIAPDILDSNCSETDQRLTQIWPNIIPGR